MRRSIYCSNIRNLHVWTPDVEESALGIIHTIPGKNQDLSEYITMHEFLTDKGFIIVGSNWDELELKGTVFLYSDYWKAIQEKEYSLIQTIKKECPSLPYFLFGSREGYCIAKSILIDHPKESFTGVIFSNIPQKFGYNESKLKKYISSVRRSRKIEKKLPIFITAGDDNLKATYNLEKACERAKMKDVTVRIYENMSDVYLEDGNMQALRELNTWLRNYII